MKVSGLALDGNSNTPVVILREANGDRVLPIWIGLSEAHAIAMVLEGVKFQRPLTHDLMKTIIDGLKATIIKVVISDLKDHTFYAKIFLRKDKEEKNRTVISVDARPSDSIALALRCDAPIYVAEEIINNEQRFPKIQETTEEERAKRLREYLGRLKPEDFGKFNA